MLRRTNGRTAFLALKDKLQSELTAGHYMKTVHERYAVELGISYRQFLRYVEKYDLRAGLRAQATPSVHAQPTVLPAAKAGHGPIVSDAPARKQFVFDPTGIHRKNLI